MGPSPRGCWCVTVFLFTILSTQLSSVHVWLTEVGKLLRGSQAPEKTEMALDTNSVKTSMKVIVASSIFDASNDQDDLSAKMNSTASSIISNQRETLAPSFGIKRKNNTVSSPSQHSDYQNPNHVDNHKLPLCKREDIYQGEWVQVSLTEVPYVPHIRCLPKEHYKPGRKWDTWDWQPSAVQSRNCTLLRWNASHFCSLTHHATIAILGDSLSWEHYASLVQLLGLTVSEHHQLVSQAKRTMVVNYVCERQVRLVYLRDDYLTHITYIINTMSPNLLVLNRGAHFTKDNRLTTDLREITAELKDWQTSCKTSQSSCHLMVRTTVPGHPNCWNFTRPAKSVRKMETLVGDRSRYNETDRRKFHWYDFQRQNLISLGIYQQANLSFDVLDGYYINILRPDDHRIRVNDVDKFDCLHSCFPGKMDLYNQLLLHFLQKRGGVVNATAPWTETLQ